MHLFVTTFLHYNIEINLLAHPYNVSLSDELDHFALQIIILLYFIYYIYYIYYILVF